MEYKFFLQFLIWLAVCLSGCQTVAFANNSSNDSDLGELITDENELSNLPIYEQVIYKRSFPASSNKSLSFHSIIAQGLTLKRHIENGDAHQKTQKLLDLRYALSIQIFPFHSFW